MQSYRDLSRWHHVQMCNWNTSQSLTARRYYTHPEWIKVTANSRVSPSESYSLTAVQCDAKVPRSIAMAPFANVCNWIIQANESLIAGRYYSLRIYQSHRKFSCKPKRAHLKRKLELHRGSARCKVTAMARSIAMAPFANVSNWNTSLSLTAGCHYNWPSMDQICRCWCEAELNHP